MAAIQPNLKRVASPAKLSRQRSVEPRFLLDELAARKLSALLAGEFDLGESLAADPLALREPTVDALNCRGRRNP